MNPLTFFFLLNNRGNMRSFYRSLNLKLIISSVAFLILIGSKNQILAQDAVPVAECGPQVGYIQQILDLTTQSNAILGNIKGDTGGILADTQVMRQILEQRQQILLQLAQMSALQKFGDVLTQAPTDSIVQNITQMLSNPSNEVSPIASGAGLITGGGSLSSPGSSGASTGNTNGISQSGNNGSSLINSGISSFLSQASSMGGFGSSFGSDAGLNSNLGISSLAGAANTASQTVSQFNNLGSMLTSSLGSVGGIQGIGNLSFNGSQFCNLNWGNIDNIQSYLGAPISMDRQIPQYMMTVNSGVSQSLASIRSQASGALSLGGLLSSSIEGQTLKKFIVSDGIVMRPQTKLDGAYYAMVQKGGNASRIQFLAAVTDGDGITYDPYLGKVHGGRALAFNYNLNDVLSAGAYNAVSDYNKKNGITGNVYSDFARVLSPLLPDIFNGAKPGMAITVKEDLVKRAKAMPPIDLSKYKGLAVSDFESDNQKIEITLAKANIHIYQRCQATSDGSGSQTIVISPMQRDQDEYNARIQASDNRISQNQRLLNVNTAMMNYCNAALSRMKTLRQSYQELAKILNNTNANETIGTLIGQCDSTILSLQNQTASYAIGIENILKTRNEEMVNRAKYVRECQNVNETTASARLSKLIIEGGGSSDSIPGASASYWPSWPVAPVAVKDEPARNLQ